MKLVMNYRSQRGINRVSFSPNGDLLATAGTDGTVKMWRLQGNRWESGERIPDAHNGAVSSAVFHPADGNVLLTAGEDGALKLWKRHDDGWEASEQTLDPQHRHHGAIRQALFSSTGNRVLSVSADKYAKVWRSTRGRRQSDIDRRSPAARFRSLVWCVFVRARRRGSFGSPRALTPVSAGYGRILRLPMRRRLSLRRGVHIRQQSHPLPSPPTHAAW